MDTTCETRDDMMLSEGQLLDEVITANLTGTAASITDTTTYAVTDQDGLTSVITTTDADGVETEQTVTFDGATTTALQVAAQMNDQLVDCSAVVTGGQVVITTDATGPLVAILAAAGTGGLEWDDAVAGTGDPATWPKGTLLARNSSTTKIEKYADSGTLDRDEPRAVLPHALTFSASGDLSTQVLVGGKVDQSKLSKLSDSTAISKAVFDKLIANTNIVPQTVAHNAVFDN